MRRVIFGFLLLSLCLCRLDHIQSDLNNLENDVKSFLHASSSLSARDYPHSMCFLFDRVSTPATTGGKFCETFNIRFIRCATTADYDVGRNGPEEFAGSESRPLDLTNNAPQPFPAKGYEKMYLAHGITNINPFTNGDNTAAVMDMAATKSFVEGKFYSFLTPIRTSALNFYECEIDVNAKAKKLVLKVGTGDNWNQRTDSIRGELGGAIGRIISGNCKGQKAKLMMCPIQALGGNTASSTTCQVGNIEWALRKPGSTLHPYNARGETTYNVPDNSFVNASPDQAFLDCACNDADLSDLRSNQPLKSFMRKDCKTASWSADLCARSFEKYDDVTDEEWRNVVTTKCGKKKNKPRQAM